MVEDHFKVKLVDVRNSFINWSLLLKLSRDIDEEVLNSKMSVVQANRLDNTT